MSILLSLFLVFPCLVRTIFSQDTCPVVSYNGRFKESDHVKDHALIGRSYKNLTTNTVQECFSTCIHDCRCVSYQLTGRRCELIDEDRHTAPDLFKPLVGYKYYQLKQHFKKSNNLGCSSQCNNGCCRYSQPCLNGGTCIDTCQNVTHKFQCKCPQGFGGRACQFPPSCAAYSTRSVPNIFPIQTTSGALKVYCDMTSEPGMVWTLIESFALSEKGKFRSMAIDLPFNEETPPNWSDYRMSLDTMKHIKRDATHWRATCNYDTDGLVKTDYVRGRLNDLDILSHVSGHTCAKVEYINVRGISCHNCTTHLRQTISVHPVIDSGYGRALSKLGCQWDGRHGSIQSGNNWCDNFGAYSIKNSAHRCSSSPSSTSQWWLGLDLE